ncbi:hypothetical protein Taro_051765 [Colocasia esculenta]|uniref:AAA+ ATPase domain-containing protein n=1 Tax=Colocasia esculenta TaxID=4460 RepID=A0A843XHU6_COLES|nr:hypothetical protein [Colocasia esculenta]
MAGVQIDITGAVRLALKPLLSTAKRINVLLQIQGHVVALSGQMEELRDVKADMEADVLAHGVPPTRMLSNQARRWMEAVDSVDEQVRKLESSLARKRSGLGGSWALYKLSRRTTRMQKRARELQEKGKRFNACRVSVGTIDTVEAVPSTWTSVVGGERALSEALQHLADDSVGIVGIYGMGGVGKTTLLTRLNNEFLAAGSHGFDVVIWVTASRDASILKIQMDMIDRLGVARSVEGLERPDQGDLRAKVLFKVLSTKRFLLLLDDLWEKLDWMRVGIPFPSPKNRCKVVFTTRSRDICVAMDAQRKVKVNVLSEAEAWDLFCGKVGDDADLENPSIGKLARRLAAKCGGLPLALITVGRAMADTRTVGEWEEAVEMLSEAPEKLPGMEEEVLTLLKFSLDRLKDETARQCLLYCCLFPEDHEIPAERLVNCWVGEGLLDTPHSDGLDRARNRGLGIIRRLKAACLLEGGGGDEGFSVKLHDVVREMAIWLTGGEYDPMNTFLVDAEKGLSCLPRVHRWAEARKVSLLGNNIEDLPGELCPCAHLSTLFINLNPLQVLPGGFLVSMPSLRVLDLSGTDITELPKEIGLLGRLQHLNLSGTRIESLPGEMATLLTLRQLDLRETYELSRVPRGAIATLTALQALNLRESGYCTEMESRQVGDEPLLDMVSLVELEAVSLCRLEELGLDILGSSASLERLMNSKRLSRCTRFLRLRAPDLSANHLRTAFEKLVNLRELHIGPCPALEELRLDIAGRQLSRLDVLELNGLGEARLVIPAEGGDGNIDGGLLPPPPWPVFLERLRSLCIIQCHGFQDLTWVKHLPCLESMQLAGCHGLEELILMDGGGGTGSVEELILTDVGGRTGSEAAGNGGCDITPLRKLKFMSLIGLPALRSISRELLLFPSLEQLHVCQCPRLTRLAMGPCSVKEMKEIVGESEWWSGLEWDDSSMNDTLLPSFRPSTEL